MRKRLTITLMLLIVAACMYAQAPQRMTYQAVVRSSTNQLVRNVPVGCRITLISRSTGSDVVSYQEDHATVTNENGLMTLEVGGGYVLQGDLSTVDWSLGPYFMRVEIDPNGGTNYGIVTEQQLLSVPYALYAETSGSGGGGEPGPQGPQGEPGPAGPQGEQGPAGVGIPQTLSISGDQLTISDGNTVTLPSNAEQLDSLQSELNSLQNTISSQDSVINALNNQVNDLLPFECGRSTIKDHEGNVYNTVQIGNQCWTKENMRCTTTPSTGATIGRYPYEDPNMAYNGYGRLYNWNSMMDGAESSGSNPSGVQGICPQGWHVPSDAEWTQLTTYVSGQSEYTCGSSAENIAKALASTTGWNTGSGTCAVGNTPADNNATGFSAVPAGGYYSSYGYYGFGYNAYFWSATQYNSDNAYYRDLYYGGANVYSYGNPKDDGYSVRCLRDGGIAGAPANNESGSNAGGNSECCNELGARVDNLQSQVSSLQNTVNSQNAQIDSLQQVIAGGGNIRYIVFNANGGNGFMNAQFCPIGVEQHINPLTFTRSGYIFLGWNTAADGTGTFYAKNAPITLTQNITLYAQWTTRVQLQLPEPCGDSPEGNARNFSRGN